MEETVKDGWYTRKYGDTLVETFELRLAHAVVPVSHKSFGIGEH